MQRILALTLVGTVTLAAFLTIAATSQTKQSTPARSYEPLVSLKGAHSDIAERRFDLVATEEAWRELWAEHRGKKDADARRAWQTVPEIDFERCLVIAFFRGSAWNCDGEYVVSVSDRGDDLLLRFDSHTYQTAGPDGGGVQVTPYGLWILPRTEKAITIEENVQGLIGQPAKWKVQHVFAAQARD
jgi:hypothetical protein